MGLIMIQQRYGNNIPLRISLAPVTVPAVSPAGLTDRHVEVSVLRRMGRTVPFAFTIEGNTILGTIFGKDQPHRDDVLSLRITLDRGTEQQHIIDIPNVVALTSSTSSATMTATQIIHIQTDGNRSFVQTAEQPRPRKTPVPAGHPAGNNPTHEQIAQGAKPDVTLT